VIVDLLITSFMSVSCNDATLVVRVVQIQNILVRIEIIYEILSLVMIEGLTEVTVF
jgi:hypothetical protein